LRRVEGYGNLPKGAYKKSCPLPPDGLVPYRQKRANLLMGREFSGLTGIASGCHLVQAFQALRSLLRSFFELLGLLDNSVLPSITRKS